MNDECCAAFDNVSKRKARYVIYKISNSTEIVVDKVSDPDASYDEMKSSLPEKDCRYVVFDYEHALPGADGIRNKLLLVAWYGVFYSFFCFILIFYLQFVGRQKQLLSNLKCFILQAKKLWKKP